MIFEGFKLENVYFKLLNTALLMRKNKTNVAFHSVNRVYIFMPMQEYILKHM